MSSVNWTAIIESVSSVAVIVVPAAVAHYKKLGTVLDTVTSILETVQSAEKKTNAVSLPPPRPGSGMENEV